MAGQDYIFLTYFYFNHTQNSLQVTRRMNKPILIIILASTYSVFTTRLQCQKRSFVFNIQNRRNEKDNIYYRSFDRYR